MFILNLKFKQDPLNIRDFMAENLIFAYLKDTKRVGIKLCSSDTNKSLCALYHSETLQ